MEFNSMEDMIKFIENKMNIANKELSEEMVNIAKDVTEKEQKKYNPTTYNRTGDLISSIQPIIVSKNLIEIGWRHQGGWTSYSGKSYPYVSNALEDGTTYGRGGYRPSTNFVELSEKKIESEIPKCYKRIMNGLGIPLV